MSVPPTHWLRRGRLWAASGPAVVHTVHTAHAANHRDDVPVSWRQMRGVVRSAARGCPELPRGTRGALLLISGKLGPRRVGGGLSRAARTATPDGPSLAAAGRWAAQWRSDGAAAAACPPRCSFPLRSQTGTTSGTLFNTAFGLADWARTLDIKETRPHPREGLRERAGRRQEK